VKGADNPRVGRKNGGSKGRYKVLPPEGCQCRHCLVRDDEVLLETLSTCCACHRALYRRGRKKGNGACPTCGRPMRKFRGPGLFLCTTCDEERILFSRNRRGQLYMRRIILLAPDDDRERVVLRSLAWFGPSARAYFGRRLEPPPPGESLVLVATPRAWRELR
jgi:hypothetical protein